MTQQWIERYWSLDRSNLAICRQRHELLSDYIEQRDAALRNRAK